MKTSTSSALIAVTAIAFFCIGRSSKPGAAASDESSAPGPRPSSSNSSTASLRPQQPGAKPSSKVSNSLERIPVERARQLTSQERLGLIEKGALVYDSGKQADLLCGVIATLTKDDIGQAVGLLAAAQDRGNFCSQAVWDAIWTQWGRVDPEGVLKVFNDKPVGKSRADDRHLMAGWWETDPAGALAWAQEPKQTQHDAVAASLALTNSAGGDPKKLEQIMLGMPAGDARLKECLRDYLDLASMTPESAATPAQTYDQLPAGLRDTAWPVILQRMSYTDPDGAAAWLSQHATDAVYDPQASFQVVQRMTSQNPKAALELAVSLPQSDDTVNLTGFAISRWASSDRNAAVAWLEAQPADSVLAKQYLPGLKGASGRN
ncbi:MAG: hypothetical protein JWO82_2345, partial [Akkermansiaceae bacterium]|nr:hypothetical protein [Akkermansiaceae bacterium]